MTDQQRIDHHRGCYGNEIARTPNIDARQGSAIDFVPTLLQRAGLRCPIGIQGQDLPADDAFSHPALIEDSGLALARDDGRTESRTIAHDGWRITASEGSGLGEDPHELTNLWSDDDAADRKQAMMLHLVDRQIALRDASLVPTHQA